MKQIKQAHLARMALDWAAIAPNPVKLQSPIHAADLDLRRAFLTHLLDTVSDHSRGRLHSWLLGSLLPLTLAHTAVFGERTGISLLIS